MVQTTPNGSSVVPSGVEPAPAPGGFATLRAHLMHSFLERGAFIDALFEAMIAGEHIVSIGDPGTGKSNIIRDVANAIGKRVFELQMTAFTTPEEVYGPLSVVALGEDRYERKLEGYAGHAEILILDEIFKANSAILNSLLSLLNEGTIRNGAAHFRTPLQTCIASSNELPEGGHSGELAALFDRFLVRIYVHPIEERENFLKLLAAGGAPPIPKVTLDLAAEQDAASRVAIPRPVLEAMADLRAATRKEGMKISDRRWVKAQKILRASVHLDGRTVATPDDLSRYEVMLWREPAEIAKVTRLVQLTVNPDGAQATVLLDAARAVREKLPPPDGTDSYVARATSARKDLSQIQKKVNELGKGSKVSAAKTEVARLLAEVTKMAHAAVEATGGA